MDKTRLGNIQWAFKSLIEKTKTFFHGIRWKEILVFSAFLLLSFAFWLLNSLQQTYEMNLKIPLKLKNKPAEIIYSDSVPAYVTATIKDKGIILLNYAMGRRSAPIEIDIKPLLENQSGNFTLQRRVIENELLKRLVSTSTLESFTPYNLKIEYGKLQSKKVPVAFNGHIQTNIGFSISDNIAFSPEQITVYAAESILDSIKEIKTEPIEIKNVDKTIKKTVKLHPITGVSFNQESVAVTIPVEEFTERKITVPITCKGLPPHYILRMFPSEVEITCNILLSKFKSISESDFEVELSYSDLENNFTGKAPIALVKQPEGIHIVNIEPTEIEFILEQSNSITLQ